MYTFCNFTNSKTDINLTHHPKSMILATSRTPIGPKGAKSPFTPVRDSRFRPFRSDRLGSKGSRGHIGPIRTQRRLFSISLEQPLKHETCDSAKNTYGSWLWQQAAQSHTGSYTWIRPWSYAQNCIGLFKVVYMFLTIYGFDVFKGFGYLW